MSRLICTVLTYNPLMSGCQSHTLLIALIRPILIVLLIKVKDYSSQVGDKAHL